MLFGAMNALGLETHLAADQGVVRVAVGTVVCAHDEHVVEQGPPGDEPGLITGRLLLSMLCLRWSAKPE